MRIFLIATAVVISGMLGFWLVGHPEVLLGPGSPNGYLPFL